MAKAFRACLRETLLQEALLQEALLQEAQSSGKAPEYM